MLCKIYHRSAGRPPYFGRATFQTNARVLDNSLNNSQISDATLRQLARRRQTSGDSSLPRVRDYFRAHFAGTVQIGRELSRRELTVELKMSILPVAEALRRPTNEGIVETQPRAGMRVRAPSAEDMREA
jgi:hypothetical protein